MSETKELKPGEYPSFVSVCRDALWSFQGVFVYFWLLFAALDFSQGHTQIGFLEVVIAILSFVIALDQQISKATKKLTDDLFDLCKEQNDLLTQVKARLPKTKQGKH